MRKEITFQQAHARILAGLPVITEETRNEIPSHPGLPNAAWWEGALSDALRVEVTKRADVEVPTDAAWQHISPPWQDKIAAVRNAPAIRFRYFLPNMT